MANVLLRRRKLGRKSTTGIVQAASQPFMVVRNWVDRLPSSVNFVFRWGCTSTVDEGQNVKVVNKSRSIHWCSDKRQGRLDMQEAGVPVPQTWGRWLDLAAYLSDTNERNFKVVLRPKSHAQGRNLYVYTADASALAAKCRQLGDFYISKLIDKVAEYRVFVCQNRVVWVARKTPGNPEQVAWNVAQGGRFDNVRWGDWPLPVIKAALAAAKVSGTDFCGVDVMVDAQGSPYVLEVNSAPSQTSEYRQRCVAQAFSYIVESNSLDHFPDVPDGSKRTYKSYIHPAVRTGQ